MIYCLPFVLFLVFSTLYALKNGVSHEKEGTFFLGNRSITTFPLVMTFIGTQVGAGFILGTADVAYKEGIFGICYPLGLSLGFLGLGLGFGARIRQLEITTISELYDKVFNSKHLQRFSSFLLLISLTGIAIALAVGMRKFLVSLDLTNPLYFVLFWGLVVFYTSKGGLAAVVRTDMVQALGLVLLLIIAFVSTFSYAPQVINTLKSTPNLTSISTSWEDSLFSLLFPFLFMFIGQDMAQRCFAAKTPATATKATLIAALVLGILACIPVWFGLLGNALGIDSTGSIFLNTVQATCSPLIFSCAASGVLLAIVSTVSSVLLAISSSLSHDLLNGKYAKSSTCLIGSLALLGGFLGNDIISCMLASYELSAAALAPSLLISVVARNRVENRPEVAWAGVIAGTVGFIYQKLVGGNNLTPLALATLATGIAYYLPVYTLQKGTSSTG